MNPWIWILLFFVCLWLAHWRFSREMINPYSRFFKIFFPSWKFFEDLGSTPKLFYRLRKPHEDFGPWKPAIFPVVRKWGQLFLNPEVNYLLAVQSQLQQLAQESQIYLEQNQIQRLQQSTSYLLIRRFIIEQIQKTESQAQEFQFKIGVIHPLNPEQVIDDVILSAVETCRAQEVKK